MEGLKFKKFPVLNDGFVTLIDVMGTDADVCQAARVSYGAGTKSVSDDRSLIRYLMRHHHCYDDQTEVLTSNGFVKWADLKPNDLLGCFDETINSLVYEKPEYLTIDEYSGLMYKVNHGGVDLVVTPEHTMYVERKWWNYNLKRTEWLGSFCKQTARQLGHSSMVRYTKVAPYLVQTPWDGCPPFDPKPMLNLIGFFIGDGHLGVNGHIIFHLKKSRKISYLHQLAEELQLEIFRVADSYEIRCPQLKGYFEQFYLNKSKNIPIEFCHLNQEDSLELLDGLKNSDGSIKRGTWTYSSTVQQVAEAIQIIALHSGLAAHYNTNDGNLWRVMVLSRMHHPVINQNSRNTSWVNYTGKVYCAKTRTGLLVVRRNGKIVISGNTTPFEMCEVKLLVRTPMDVWRQWIRSRTASVNEYSTRYSVAIDSKATTDPESWRAQSKDRKQGSGDCIPSGLKQGELVEYEKSGGFLSSRENELHDLASLVYEERLEAGVAREQARKDLPLSTYTEAYWKMDLHNLLHFLYLRMDSYAQLEIRQYANIIGNEIVAKLFPIVWEAFVDFIKEPLVLSRLDEDVLCQILGSNTLPLRSGFFEEGRFGWNILPKDWKKPHSSERSEFIEKIRRLGIIN